EVLTMNDHDVTREFEEIERAARRTDPAFVRRLERQVRRNDQLALAVFALLAVGAVLLTVGLATTSLAVWLGGFAALGASVVADRLRLHLLHRPPEPAAGDAPPRPDPTI